MYLKMQGDTVAEIIPEINPAMPGVPIEQRYPAAYLAGLLRVPDDTVVGVGYIKTEGGFTLPVEPGFPPEPPAPEPTYAERVAALEDAMLTLMLGGA